ncbi:hypothetical protein KGQ71_04605, partial [Patescibacteria group bacterium]|nr:hypothetical protein [Patescibacteria group bacterium]
LSEGDQQQQLEQYRQIIQGTVRILIEIQEPKQRVDLFLKIAPIPQQDVLEAVKNYPGIPEETRTTMLASFRRELEIAHREKQASTQFDIENPGLDELAGWQA